MARRALSEQLNQYSDCLLDCPSSDRIPVGETFSAIAHIGPGVKPGFCTMGNGSFYREDGLSLLFKKSVITIIMKQVQYLFYVLRT